MPTGKRYTNATFTKRVDHIAGRHRQPRAAGEPRVCASCGSVYKNRRWVTAGAAALQRIVLATGDASPTVVQCPACRLIEGGTPSGVLYVDGTFADAHADELGRLITSEASRAAEDNPTGRVMATTRDSERRLVVTTTTEHLAQRLGHALQKVYKGHVRFDFSHENKFARVYWHRD